MADVREGNPAHGIKKKGLFRQPLFCVNAIFYILSITMAVAPPPPLQIPATPVPAFF